jgi:hypothetical protein
LSLHDKCADATGSAGRIHAAGRARLKVVPKNAARTAASAAEVSCSLPTRRRSKPQRLEAASLSRTHPARVELVPFPIADRPHPTLNKLSVIPGEADRERDSRSSEEPAFPPGTRPGLRLLFPRPPAKSRACPERSRRVPLRLRRFGMTSLKKKGGETPAA